MRARISMTFDVECDAWVEEWWGDLQGKLISTLENFTNPLNLVFDHEVVSEDISDKKLESAAREAKAMAEITEVLKHVGEGKRLRVLRAASILSTGKDLGEL